METKEMKVIVEMAQDGSYSAYSEGFSGGIIAGQGNTIAEATEDFGVALQEVIEMYREEGNTEASASLSDIKPTYQLDIVSFLKHQKFLNLSQLAKSLGINVTLMHQYKAGQYMSESRAHEIREAIAKIGKELSAVCM